MRMIAFTCPNCRGQVSVPASAAGASRPCPDCSEWVHVPEEGAQPVEEVLQKKPATDLQPPADKRPPSRPSRPAPVPAPAMAPAPTSIRRSGANSGGWSCLVTGLVLMCFLPAAHLLYLPLFVVAFILGIVAMAQGRVVGGQLILILSLLAPVMLGVRFHGMELPEWATISGLTPAQDEVESEEPMEEESQPGPAETELVPPETADESEDENSWFQVEDAPVEPAPTTDWGSPVDKPTTDWRARYDYWFEQYGSRFSSQVPGAYVTLELSTGGQVEGTLRAVGPREVTLQIPNGSVTYRRDQLSEATRRSYFRGDFARYYATRRVRLEQQREQPKRTTGGFGDFL